MKRSVLKVSRWMSVLAVAGLLWLPTQGFGALTVTSKDLVPADGTTGQDVTVGNGVKTNHIQDLAITTSKVADGAITDGKISGLISAAKISDGVFQKRCANVIVVAKSGGDYVDPVEAATAANSVATVDNPYLIKVMPGVYNVIQTVALNSYVSLEGAGMTSTIIRGNNIGTTVSTMGDNTVSNIRIEAISDGSAAYSIALNVAKLSQTEEARVTHVILNAQGGQNVYALRADRLRLIGDDITANASGGSMNNVGIFSTNNSPQITNTVVVSSGVGVLLRNEYGYDGRLLPSPTFNGLVVEGQSVGFYNDYCYYNPRIRNSRITGTSQSLLTYGGYPGTTTTYVSNSELNGPTIGANGTNVCAGVSDAGGMFYSNACP